MRPALALIALVALFVPACSDADTAPAALEPPRDLTIAYEAALDAPVTAALAEWPREAKPIRFEPDISTAIALRAAASHRPPDVLVISSQTSIPEGPNTPIATRKWITDPVVFVTRTDETRTIDELLLAEDTRLAIVHESEPLGQYTRFGLRKLDRWSIVEDRALRFPTAEQLLNAVESSTADFAAVYASQLATRLNDSPEVFAQRQELLVPESSRQAFALVTMTPEGVELAQWLADDARMQILAGFGYQRDAGTKTPAR